LLFLFFTTLYFHICLTSALVAFLYPKNKASSINAYFLLRKLTERHSKFYDCHFASTITTWICGIPTNRYVTLSL